ncbi:hypothetical protein E2C01_049638 [Portunus trituberculatus]|uniref:Uncharacterized protein n=1 Tax=Portunus trituberculatus TaxID=210409 RepID=A0A5B7GGL2_PORTR|nr:hypothetical protein [Portunus trituberculatus]
MEKRREEKKREEKRREEKRREERRVEEGDVKLAVVGSEALWHCIVAPGTARQVRVRGSKGVAALGLNTCRQGLARDTQGLTDWPDTRVMNTGTHGCRIAQLGSARRVQPLGQPS